jgi:hypothetical protein
MSIKHIVIAAALVTAAGCGSDDDGGKGGGAPTSAKAPNQLVGSYTTRLERSDLPPKPAPELADSLSWKLTIANSGAVGGKPAFTISDPQRGTLESSSFGVDGDRIHLRREECAAGGTEHFYDNEYRYELAGKRLTLTKARNKCPDRVAETILTSRPWTKVD